MKRKRPAPPDPPQRPFESNFLDEFETPREACDDLAPVIAAWRARHAMPRRHDRTLRGRGRGHGALLRIAHANRDFYADAPRARCRAAALVTNPLLCRTWGARRAGARPRAARARAASRTLGAAAARVRRDQGVVRAARAHAAAVRARPSATGSRTRRARGTTSRVRGRVARARGRRYRVAARPAAGAGAAARGASAARAAAAAAAGAGATGAAAEARPQRPRSAGGAGAGGGVRVLRDPDEMVESRVVSDKRRPNPKARKRAASARPLRAGRTRRRRHPPAGRARPPHHPTPPTAPLPPPRRGPPP